MKLPLQPFIIDAQGTVRFQANAIVRALLDLSRRHGIDLNSLALMNFSQADQTQFASLIGYSLSGFHELPYVSDADARAATEAARLVDETCSGCRDCGCQIHCGVEEEKTNV